MRSYNQFCSMARALDVVGDRWALLVARELMLGPQRYTDLLDGLPGIGTNVLSTRLRELEAAGVVGRRRLPAPTPVTVYELTDDGRDLRAVLDALVRWGARRLTTPADDDTVAARWLVSSFAACLPADALGDGATFDLHVGGEAFALEVRDGVVTARHGEAAQPAAALHGTLRDVFSLAKGRSSARKKVTLDGDPDAGRRLVDAVTGCLA